MHRPAPSAPYGGVCMEVCLQRIRAQALMTSIHLQGQLQRVRTQDTASVWSPYGGLPPDGTHAAPVSRMEGQLRRMRMRHADPVWKQTSRGCARDTVHAGPVWRSVSRGIMVRTPHRSSVWSVSSKQCTSASGIRLVVELQTVPSNARGALTRASCEVSRTTLNVVPVLRRRFGA